MPETHCKTEMTTAQHAVYPRLLASMHAVLPVPSPKKGVASSS